MEAERAAETGGSIGEAENGGRPCDGQAMVASQCQFQAGSEARTVDKGDRNRIEACQTFKYLLAIPCERRAISRMSQTGECRGTKARAECVRDRRAKDQGCEAGGKRYRTNGIIELAQGFEIQRVGWLPAETERKRGGPVVGGHRDVTRLEQHGTGFCPHQA